MATTFKLTNFSKFLIFLFVVAGIVFGLSKMKKSGFFDNLIPKDKAEGTHHAKDADVINIGVVTWGGYAGGQYFNEGFEASEASRFYKDYGLLVNFKVLDDYDASREAFKADEVNLLWATIDAFPTEVEGLKDYDPQVVFQADWSRGGDAIVVRRGINNVSDLKGKKIAVAPMSPSHTFLIWLLEAGDLKTSDVEIVQVPSAIDAADAFKSGTVDAAVVWSPDDQDCVEKVPGAKILENTKNASHIIADVFYAKKSWLDANRDKVAKLYEGWMIGAGEINSSEEAKQKAAKILSEGLKQPEDFCYNAINNVRLATHGDNLDFFGLNPEYNGVTGEALYNKMKTTYAELGFAPERVPSWRLVAYQDPVASNRNLNTPEQAAEGQKSFAAPSTEDVKREAISTKRVSISFRTGEFILDENAKYIIDKEFVDIARAFSNSRIRIEGNSDNVGSPQMNTELSRKRAQSVADYLQKEHNMPANRFIVIGNGPNKPVADNSTEAGRSQNRRTDFELVAN
ncbi:MAG: phosphate ABC transporter substrate-binding/OmpA family protein [Bacteroidia bacterium]